jgi:hypothetical protein
MPDERDPLDDDLAANRGEAAREASHPDREIEKDPDAAYTARPDAPDAERFSEGQETVGDDAVGDFAEGQATDAGAHKAEVERFSEGQEELPETPEKEHEGTFAEGQEELGEDDDPVV